MSTTPATKDALFYDMTRDFPLIVRGEGIYLYDDAGNRYIDAAAGAYNVTLGHGRKRIAAAMAEQAETLAFAFSAYYLNQPALDLAERIAAVAPGDLNNVYFVCGGSEAVETATKIARHYHVQRGNGSKHLVISRWRGYHGTTLGAMSVSGSAIMRKLSAPLLAGFPHIEPCHPYRCNYAGCEGTCNLTCARELERAILYAGPENVSAFIAEPVVQSGIAAGVPPPDYFPLIREICDKYDVLFIADEVVTGFGRTGKYFAMEHWGVEPDLAVFGKGASGGYSPLGGVVFQDAIYDCFAESGEVPVHIHTYVNYPISARVGLEVLDIIEEENLLDHVPEIGDYLLRRARELDKHPMIGDVRGMGLILGFELVKDKQTKEPFEVSEKIGKRLRDILLERGLSVVTSGGSIDGVTGDSLQLSPPFIITRNDVDEMIAIIDAGLGQLESELSL